jgi:hypothetical protein
MSWALLSKPKKGKPLPMARLVTKGEPEVKLMTMFLLEPPILLVSNPKARTGPSKVMVMGRLPAERTSVSRNPPV